MVFPYTPVGWTEDVSSLGPANFNHMDEAIRAAFNRAAGAVCRFKISGLSFSSVTGHRPLLFDSNTLYNYCEGTFGRIDLATGVYTALAAAPDAYSEGQAALVKVDADTIVLVYAISSTVKGAAIYTISTNQWSATYQRTGITSPRESAAAVDGGLVYVVASESTAGGAGLWTFNPTTHAWTQKRAFALAAATRCAGIYDGYIYWVDWLGDTYLGWWTRKCPIDGTANPVEARLDIQYGGQPRHLFISSDGKAYCCSHVMGYPGSYTPNYHTGTDYAAVTNLDTGQMGFADGGLPTGDSKAGNPDFMNAAMDTESGIIWGVYSRSSSDLFVIQRFISKEAA